jgi:hypothetical protein
MIEESGEHIIAGAGAAFGNLSEGFAGRFHGWC